MATKHLYPFAGQGFTKAGARPGCQHRARATNAQLLTNHVEVRRCANGSDEYESIEAHFCPACIDRVFKLVTKLINERPPIKLYEED